MELKGFETIDKEGKGVYISSGRVAKTEIDGNFVTFKISNAHKDMQPFAFEKEPSMLMAVIKKFEELNPGCTPDALILQLTDTVIYRYKRIL
jgi:hypothetical protein